MHVNHGLSPLANAWADFCSELCFSHNIKLEVVRVVLSDISRSGIEASARRARYAALMQGAPDFVLVAHHQNDQAETILMQLLRGSGAKGLSAMAETNSAYPRFVLRPMLSEPDSEISDYAAEHRLSWITDESNDDTRFTRNFVRHDLFPVLEARFPGATKAMARSAAHMAEAQVLMDNLAEIDIAGLQCRGGVDLLKLCVLDAARAKNVLRFYFMRNGLDLPQGAHLDELIRQIKDIRQDSKMTVRLGKVVARCHKGVLFFDFLRPAADLLDEFPWDGESVLRLPALGGHFTVDHVVGEGISAKKLKEAPVFVRLRKGGERIQLHASRPTRTLKNLLREADIPYWRRDCLPLVYCGTELVFVPGLGIARDYLAGKDENGLVMKWSETRARD
jgi:tRNA(Ile)-lysidine synthase